MQNLIFKIISITSTAIVIFVAAFKCGKIRQKNKQLQGTINNVKKAKNIENSISKLSHSDKLERL